jgi:hypothetical protein
VSGLAFTGIGHLPILTYWYWSSADPGVLLLLVLVISNHAGVSSSELGCCQVQSTNHFEGEARCNHGR